MDKVVHDRYCNAFRGGNVAGLGHIKDTSVFIAGLILF